MEYLSLAFTYRTTIAENLVCLKLMGFKALGQSVY